MASLLGCIADDFTGATDVAGVLVKNGMRTVQMIGIGTSPQPVDGDAIVVALKTRTAPKDEAVKQSLAALDWLTAMGCSQFLFKYCSTFDSTNSGNIGPVIEALMDVLGAEFTIACPAYPRNKRTLFQGHLFVADALLHETEMRDHPLTPMSDSNLVRVLQRQTSYKVGLIPYETIRDGAVKIQSAFSRAQGSGMRIAIVDAVCEANLKEIARACRSMRLITGASGLAVGLPANFRAQGLLATVSRTDPLPIVGGLSAVIAGSCSAATRRQVAVMKDKAPAFYVDPLRLAAGGDVVGEAVQWAAAEIRKGPVLIYATSDAAKVNAVQSELGTKHAGDLVENALAMIAQGLVDLGVRKMVIAGGETSGAIVAKLGIPGLRIGPEIDPGIPWTVTWGERPLALALKSGNFGTDDLFLKAWKRLP